MDHQKQKSFDVLWRDSCSSLLKQPFGLADPFCRRGLTCQMLLCNGRKVFVPDLIFPLPFKRVKHFLYHSSLVATNCLNTSLYLLLWASQYYLCCLSNWRSQYHFCLDWLLHCSCWGCHRRRVMCLSTIIRITRTIKVLSCELSNWCIVSSWIFSSLVEPSAGFLGDRYHIDSSPSTSTLGQEELQWNKRSTAAVLFLLRLSGRLGSFSIWCFHLRFKSSNGVFRQTFHRYWKRLSLRCKLSDHWHQSLDRKGNTANCAIPSSLKLKLFVLWWLHQIQEICNRLPFTSCQGVPFDRAFSFIFNIFRDFSLWLILSISYRGEITTFVRFAGQCLQML
jgi:hypothetical protein